VLQAWAAEHVAERAAVPKLVTIIDALPVTAVGKPYKLSLRADAARSAVEEELAGAVGVDGVDAGVDEGSIVVTVTVDFGVDAEGISATLGRYTFTWDIKERS
jgi:fatty-acyl-CoA synthase